MVKKKRGTKDRNFSPSRSFNRGEILLFFNTSSSRQITKFFSLSSRTSGNAFVSCSPLFFKKAREYERVREKDRGRGRKRNLAVWIINETRRVTRFCVCSNEERSSGFPSLLRRGKEKLGTPCKDIYKRVN